jgi:uncharacterized protein YegJ (DUF2314 family)
VRGVCSMARSSMPNSANSQFFICFDDATFLDKQYTVWGKVIEGMENVDKLAHKGEGPPRPFAPDLQSRVARHRMALIAGRGGRGHRRVPDDDAEMRRGRRFWLVDISRQGDKLIGRINNDPEVVGNVVSGQNYEFSEADITDWMFMRNGRIVGNATMRPLLKRMPPEEAETYRNLLETP